MKPFIFMIKDKNNNRQKKILHQLEEALLKFGQLPDDKKDDQAYSALVEIFSDAVYNHVAVTVPVNIDSNLFPAEKLKKGNIINVNFAETVTMNDITTFSDAEHEGLIYNIFTSEDMAFEADIDRGCWYTFLFIFPFQWHPLFWQYFQLFLFSSRLLSILTAKLSGPYFFASCTPINARLRSQLISSSAKYQAVSAMFSAVGSPYTPAYTLRNFTTKL